MFDLGHYGSKNDSGVLAKSEMGQLIEAENIGIPDAAKYSTCDFDPLPHFFVGDKIFPLKTWLMRHYPGSLTLEQIMFNYRQSCARRTIENVFGINIVSQYMVENFVLACLALHNYLRLTDNVSYCPSGFID